MQYFKSWKEIAPTATDAEKDLKTKLEGGRNCNLGPQDKIPPAPDDWDDLPSDREIRADVLRFFLVHATAGGLQPHERGLQLSGAYISGRLDLAYCTVSLRSALRGCRFQFEIFAETSDWAFGLRLEHCAAPSFNGAGCKIGGQLDFDGAEFTATEGDALNLQGAEIKDSLFLRNAKITGTANLPRLKLGGQLSCTGAKFTATEGHALNLQGAEIQEGLFLREAHITGTAHLSGLKLGGQLSCTGAEFTATEGDALNLQGAEIKEDLFLRNAKITGTANLPGLKLGGQLGFERAEFTATEGYALTLGGAEIKGGLFLRKLKSFSGCLDLTAAKTVMLDDDSDSIQMPATMFLDGFTYDRISGPTDAETRIQWLERGDFMNGEFAPQPYKQLAKVLHDMGHEADAREVHYTLAKKLEDKRLHALWNRLTAILHVKPSQLRSDALSVVYFLNWLWTKMFNQTAGYGWKPFRSLRMLSILICCLWVPTVAAWYAGDMAPNSAVILLSDDWEKSTNEPHAAVAWSDTVVGKDWGTFYSFVYAADVVIPLIEFGQTDAWAPSTSRGPVGKLLVWLAWPFTIAGWLVTALGAAAIGGIIRRE